MPNLAELNVLIGADVTDLNTALERAKGSIVNFTNLAKSLDELRPFSPFIVKAIEAAKSVDNLKDALAQLKIEQAAATNPKELTAYNNAVRALTTEIKILSTAEKTVEVETKAIAQSSSVLTTGLSGLSKGFSLVRQAAYLLPGIGIAGIFDLAFQAISKAAESLGIFADSEKEVADQKAAEAVKQFAAELNNAASGALASGVRLKEFVNIAKDGQLPIEQRNAALREANKILGEHGEKLTLVNINTASATAEVEKFTQALIAQAVANKYSDALADKIISQANAYKALKQANLDYQNAVKHQNDKAFSFDETAAAFAKARQAAHDAAVQYNKDGADITNLQNDLNEAIRQSTGLFGELGFKTKDAAGSAKTMSSILDDLNKKFESIGVREDLFGFNIGSFDPERISAIKSAINELININADKSVIQVLADQALTLENRLAAVQTKIDLFGAKGGIAAPGAKQATGSTPNPGVIPLTGLADQSIKLFESTEAKIKASAERISAALRESLVNIFTSAFQAIGEAIGDVFSGKQNPFEALGRVLGQGIKALGAQLIKLGVEAAIVKNAIKNIFGSNPVVLIGAGIALEAIGSAISNLGIQQHAEGGIFNKPTLIGNHLFGERGPEVLLPLNRLSSMLQGMNGQNVNVSGSVELGFDKFMIMFRRAQQYTSRGYGNFTNG